MIKSVCFATTDVKKSPKARGVSETARVLAGKEWNVTMLVEGGKFGVAEEYERYHVSIQRIDDLVGRSERAEITAGSMSSFQTRSRLFHAALLTLTKELKNEYDLIEFPGMGAVGFIPIQMKKSSRAYRDSKIIVNVHCPSGRFTERGFQWATMDDLINDYMEKYSFENADVQASTSRDLLNWCRQCGWKIKSTASVCPITCGLETEPKIAEDFLKHREITFFGQAADQKGIEAFIGALHQMRESDSTFPQCYRATFVWDETNGGAISKETVSRILDPYPAEFHAFSNLEEGFNYLKAKARVAVLALGSNDSLYHLIGCMMNCIPFVAMKRAGVTDVLGEGSDLHRVATGDEHNLADLIRNYLAYDMSRIQDLVDKAYRRARTLCDPARTVQWYARLVSPRGHDRLADKLKPEVAVTVIIPTRNASKYLNLALESLANQTYKNCRIIISDSSTDENEVLRTRYLGKRQSVRVLHCNESGICNAMNHGLRYVDTKYIVEFDSDNIAMPHMIETFVRAMEHRTDVVALASYNAQFYDEDENKLLQSLQHETPFVSPWYYTPVGLCLPNLFLQNVAGDATSIYLTKALKDIGGWPEDIRGPQDWLLWLKLAETRRQMDVVPEVLYYYRIRPNSVMRSMKPVEMDLAQISAIQRIIKRQPETFCKSYSSVHRLLRRMENVTEENRELLRRIDRLALESQELYQIKQSLGYKFVRFYGSRIDRLLKRNNQTK